MLSGFESLPPSQLANTAWLNNLTFQFVRRTGVTKIPETAQLCELCANPHERRCSWRQSESSGSQIEASARHPSLELASEHGARDSFKKGAPGARRNPRTDVEDRCADPEVSRRPRR